MNETVWIATKNVRVGECSFIKCVIGVFETESEAVAACKEPCDMVGMMWLGEVIDENRPWPGAYYPVAVRLGLV